MKQSTYTILVRNNQLAGWNAFKAAHPEAFQELEEFLITHPTNIRVTNGKCKKLKGRLKNLRQYDITYSDRVWYKVDKAELVVRIVYAGLHPD